jgi:GNAT superfamily N-acetyltransferase
MPKTRPSVDIVNADLCDKQHQEAIIRMLDAYALDPMGDGKPLAHEVRKNLIPGLQQHPTTIIFLAYSDNAPVGIAVCFRGFSTFAARPLINIHDFAVLPAHRGKGIGRMMLQAVEDKAVRMGCCKLTLETQEYNRRARRVYESAGFSQAVYRPEAGGSLFYSKTLKS